LGFLLSMSMAGKLGNVKCLEFPEKSRFLINNSSIEKEQILRSATNT